MSKQNNCNCSGLQSCKCHKTIVNKPVEVKVGGAGNDGLDAYRIAVLEGFVGTREEWLESLKGKDGDKIEERYSKSDNPDTPPYFDPTERYPNGWTTQVPSSSGTYIWVIKAYVTSGIPSVLKSNWTAYRTTGLNGVGEYLEDEL